ncbi:septin [Saccharomycopsis crataegensis]|uniref:Septin n=1 Tax=Saccharomycopsis crataegensis TaxID=43959 RepID=A0AAV5QK21_9ASCO|nr:septin [Saccharomycopsis crataegensis]
MVAVIQSSALRKKKSLKKGIQFTLMVVGQSGTGRSTFINSLCGQEVVVPSSTIPDPKDDSLKKEMTMRTENVELEDAEGVKISLTIIDTPGFGDSIDNEMTFEKIIDYIRHQYDEILLEESRVRRNPRFKDGRVHALLYFIVPTGHGLREIDVTIMSKLSSLVNVIPVISKSDSLTREELELNKKLINEDMKHYGIPIYGFPFDLDYDDEETIDANTYLKTLIPFAVVGSNDTFEADDGSLIRARKYPWGLVDIEDPEQSDFIILRNALLISHLQDLKEYTHEVLYEKFRTEALSGKNDEADEADDSVLQVAQAKEIIKSRSASVGKGSEGYLAREEQIKLEEERLREYEEKVEQELLKKRQELLDREKELREMEERLTKERLQSPALSAAPTEDY